MTKDSIAKKINNYTHKKIVIVSLMFISISIMIVCAIVDQFVDNKWVTYSAIISYFFIIIMVVIACKFNLNELLMKVITIDDYKEILKYMTEIPNDISMQKFYDSLFMIKRTLNEMVYYHINGVDENFRKHLCYLQAIFLGDDKTNFVSSKVLNKVYLKRISGILLEQINKGNFIIEELENVNVNDEKMKKQFHITAKMLTNVCNAILIIIVIVKVAMTINNNWYNSINDNDFLKIMYNTSVDIIAVCIAIIAWQEK